MFIYSLDKIPENSKIFIYGKGSRSEQFKAFMESYRQDVEVVGIVDTASLDEFLENKPEYDFIVIASVHWKEISERLSDKNIDEYKILSNEMAGIIYGYQNHIRVNNQYNLKAAEVLEMFNQDRCKELYNNLYGYRTNNEPFSKIVDYSVDNINSCGNQYLDFIKKDNISTIIEGGMYDGYNTNKFIKEFKKLKNVYGFEPLKEIGKFNYSKLVNSEKLSVFEVLAQGLWHKSEKVYFNIANSGSSSITLAKMQNESIDTTSIDEFVCKNKLPKVDFIKMDIEDAELNALKGGISTIKKDRPQMAICIYHSLDQFINIPLFLKQNIENYTYYLGHYSCSLNETVLYAIPKELE